MWHHRPRFSGAAMEWVMVGLELAVAGIIGLALWVALRK